MRSRLGAPLSAGVLSAALFLLPFGLGRSVSLPFGPADRDYAFGFRPGWERGTTERWARAHAVLAFPVVLAGPTELVLAGERPGLSQTVVEVRQAGRLLGRFVSDGSARALRVRLDPSAPAVFSLRAPTAAVDKSLRLSRATLVPRRPWAVVPGGRLVLRVALGAAVLAAAFAFAGVGAWPGALLAVVLLGLPLAIGGSVDPFAALHLVRKALVLGVAPAALAALVLPRAFARRAVPVLALALLFRAGLVFHPTYYFQDVDIHRQVTAVAERRGAAELWRNMPRYQQQFELGKAGVRGRYRPFPYPPTFYTLASWLRPAPTVEVIKGLGVCAQGAAVLLVMALAWGLWPGLPEVLAAGLLATFLPGDVLQLLRASYPAILGHVLDLGLIAFLALRWKALETRTGPVLVALWLAACGLTYNASPVYLGILLPLLVAAASLPPRLPGRLGLVVGILGGALLGLLYYGPAVPGVLAKVEASQAAETVRFSVARRLALGLGEWDEIGLPALVASAAGLAILLRLRWREPIGRVAAAWLAYVPVIGLIVFLLPEPFYYLRRLYFVFPLVPLGAVQLARGRRGWLAAVTAVLLVAFLLQMTAFVRPFFVTHTGSLAPG